MRDLQARRRCASSARASSTRSGSTAITRHGYKGALELAATVDYLFGYDATADVVDDWMYERADAQRYAARPGDAGVLRSAATPGRCRDIAERLLEAIERGLWERPEEATLAALRGAYLAAEADLEERDE